MKSVLIIGASRGIGRQIALTLGRHGYGVGVAAKTQESSKKSPGTVYSVSEEITGGGGSALPLVCNVRDIGDIDRAVDACIDHFKHLDALVYNAGAVTWEKVAETPLKRYELMHDVNVRGAYAALQRVLPHFTERKSGKIILVAPPIYSRFFKGKTPYSITKVGMTILAHGLGHELEGTGVSVSALWPATVIESQVTTVMNVPPAHMRNAEIFADACLEILGDDTGKYNGRALLDEDLLREAGVTDFTKYRCDPNVEPPRMMPRVLPSLRVAEEEESLSSKL